MAENAKVVYIVMRTQCRLHMICMLYSIFTEEFVITVEAETLPREYKMIYLCWLIMLFVRIYLYTS